MLTRLYSGSDRALSGKVKAFTAFFQNFHFVYFKDVFIEQQSEGKNLNFQVSRVSELKGIGNEGVGEVKEGEVE